MRMFGWVDRVDDTCVVATEFVHVAGVPLWPGPSHLIDTTSMTTNRERSQELFGTELRETTSFKSIPLGRHPRSVAAGYLRTWGVILATFGAATATEALLFLYVGGALLVAGLGARRLSFLRLADQLVLFGVGGMLGAFGGIFVSRIVAGVVTVVAAGGVALTWTWRRANAERAQQFATLLGIPADVIEARRTLTERAAGSTDPSKGAVLPQATARTVARPSAPVIPITSAAPERVEQAADAPRFLGGD